jgi:ferredoxin
MTWRIEVDDNLCIASGMCAGLAPEYFELEGDHAEPVTSEAEPDEILLDAADSCPAMAIKISEGSEVVGPRP